MSVLETPRLYFRGKITWDPIVTNNLAAQYDEDTSKTVFGSGAVDVAAFRADAVTAVTGGNWNPHGTHRSTFYETSIVGVDVGNGLATDDPIVNCPVAFTGMLVDLEPYGALTSQVFFDAIGFGIEGGCQVFAPRHTRMTGRYINFARNASYGGGNAPAGGASVVFQTSFPKQGGLRLAAHHSAVVEQFAKALQDDDVLGLTVRWDAYFTRYFDSSDQDAIPALAQQLQNKLKAGGFQPNPARSEIVGVLGLWRKGEPASEPGDRALLTRQPNTIASAHARLSSDSLTLDLANSVPEQDTDLAKVNLGDLTVVAVDPNGNTVATLGSFGYGSYDRKAYEATAGLVTLKVDPADAQKAQTNDLRLQQTNGAVLLAESALRAIPAMPNFYIDEGDNTALEVQVLDRGKPAAAGIAVAMANFTSSAGSSVSRTTNAQGIATFPLVGTTGQIEGYMLVPGNGVPLPRFNQQITTYVYVRTRPADERIAKLPPVWANVDRFVLRNWRAMAPCMDNWLDLGNPDQIKSFAAMLRRLTDNNNFESFRFMPVTRDMTAGERTLLYAFLDGGPVATAAASVDKASLDTESVLQKGRALRGG